MIKIEKNVPMPTARFTKKIYPFSEMEVGDSFLAKNGTVARAANGFSKYHKNGWRFATRKEGEGVRIWRIA
jgi:hypothetical protein